MTFNERRAKLDELVLKVTRKGQDRFDKRQLALPSYPGILGETNDQGSASVPNVQNYVYVRVGAGETVDRAFNDRVQPRNGMPVWVGYLAHQPSLFQVISVRQVHGDQYSGGEGATVGPHRQTHQHGDPVGGDDAPFISPRQLTSGLVWITDPPSMDVTVGSASYQIDNITYQTEAYLLDTTPHLPVSKPKWIVLYLDQDEVLKVLHGVESVPLTHQNIPQNTSPAFRLCAIKLEPTTTAITDFPGEVMIKDLRYASVKGNDFGAIGLKTDLIEESTAAEGVAFSDVLKITGASDDNIFRIAETALYVDFRGTDYDTKAKCQAAGVRFSDDDVPFPDSLLAAYTTGTWTHSAGNGWEAATSTDEQGPGLVIPIVRPGNWYAELRFDIGGLITTNSRVEIGALTATNHVVGYGESRNPGTLSHQAYAHLFSNDGDDTFTERFGGSPKNNPSYVYLRFRCQNGCIGVYDHDDFVWEWYEGRNAVGVAYTPAYAFVQVRKMTGAAMATIRLEWLKIVYTL